MTTFKDENDDGELPEESMLVGEQWADEVRNRLGQALRVWIATAYMDLSGVDMLKNILNAAPVGKHREIRILLDKQFHNDKKYCEVVINRLYQLPNVVVRLANTPAKFHPKLYVFNQGSYTSCLVGSMNLTGAAMERNTELGHISNQPDEVKEYEDFFRLHWQTAQTAPKTKLLEYTGPKFQITNIVEIIKSGLKGVVLQT